jgi:hypothetical protein
MEQRLARCVTPLTFGQLCAALQGSGARGATISINGIPVILSSMKREDGSGNSFILEVYHGNKCYTSYVRLRNAA